jgi:hypothetical protein
MAETESLILQESPDFSLVLGGPLYQLFRRAHLSGNALELLHRRILAIVLVAWLPLLLLSLFGGHAVGTSIKVPFLHDIEVHVRFLIAVPLLIAAELIVHVRNGLIVRRFLDRRIVTQEELPRFRAAIVRAEGVRNSVAVEATLLVLVFTGGHWLWRSQVAMSAETWYAALEGTRWRLTAAGYWYAYVSIPIFQFLLARWGLRLFIWFGFLRRVARLDLHLVATHPDRSGGLAFLGKSAYAFGPILLAQGSLLSGLIANRVLYEGANLLSFKLEVLSLEGFLVLVVFSPLLAFAPQLMLAKQKGLGAYGLLASRYVQGFEEKWVHQPSPDNELLGSPDIQSLADLSNSYQVVREMRIVPFGLEDVARLAITTAAPLVPLGLLVLSPEDLISRIVKIVL